VHGTSIALGFPRLPLSFLVCFYQLYLPGRDSHSLQSHHLIHRNTSVEAEVKVVHQGEWIEGAQDCTELKA